MSIANEISRLNTAKADIKTAIQNKGVTVSSSTKIDGYPSLINQIQTFDPYNGHDYVEIGGLKWATMNIGASSVTDVGLYFQWGDTTGYARSQVGTSETANAKPFKFQDYKFGNGTADLSDTSMTKYNSSDGKTVLDICDDAARANWGGNWRMPTIAEFQALKDVVNIEWTTNYLDSGVTGLICTDKTDSSKVLFFPAAGYCSNDSVRHVGSDGYYWSSSLKTNNRKNACSLYNYAHYYNYKLYAIADCSNNDYRHYGFPVRGVVG